MFAVRLSQISACLRTLEGQSPAVYTALASGLAWQPAGSNRDNLATSRPQTTASPCRTLSTYSARWPWQHVLPNVSSCHKSSFSSGQRGFAADATPSSPEADQINPLLQAPTPGIAGLDGVGKPSDTAQAILRGASISPKKLNRFAAVVRGLHVEDALIQCKTSPQKAAKMCHRLIQSAKANATNNHGLTADKLFVELAFVGKGQYLQRTRIHGRGRSGSMNKYRAHLTVVLREGFVQRRVKIGRPLMERWQSKAPAVAVAKTTGNFQAR